jgi:hypothetical protein
MPKKKNDKYKWEIKDSKEPIWMLSNEQMLELESQGYVPIVCNVWLYADEFKDPNTWTMIKNIIGADGDKVRLAVMGISEE